MSPHLNGEKSSAHVGVRYGENLRVSVAANQVRFKNCLWLPAIAILLFLREDASIWKIVFTSRQLETKTVPLGSHSSGFLTVMVVTRLASTSEGIFCTTSWYDFNDNELLMKMLSSFTKLLQPGFFVVVVETGSKFSVLYVGRRMSCWSWSEGWSGFMKF